MKFKSKIGTFILASSLLFSGALVGCKKDSGGSTPPPPTFEVTITENSDYTITGDGWRSGDKFKEGDEVSFTVTLTNPSDYVIDGAMFNEENCDPEGAGVFTFLMPAEAVTVRALYHEIAKHTLEVTPEPVVRGLVSTAKVMYDGGIFTESYTIVKLDLEASELGEEEVAGDVSINNKAITGVTVGKVKLDAQQDGVSILEDGPIYITVREPGKGESPETAWTPTEAYVRIQNYGADKQEANQYVAGTIREITENLEQYPNVSFVMDCKNKKDEDVAAGLKFSRIGAEWNSELRNALDVGSYVTVCSTLYRSNTTYRVQDGSLISVNNETPVALVSTLSGLILKPGQTGNADARIAPRGSSSDPLTYTIPAADAAIATVDADGTVHAVGEGSTTLTVAAEGYTSLSIPVAVVNIEHDGSEDSPYTVDEAVLVTSSLGVNGKVADKYVEGVVDSVVENHEEGFTNSTFYLHGSSKNFYCYRVNTGSEVGNNYEDLVKGALVKIHVTLYNYNGTTPENDKGESVSIDKSKARLIETDDTEFQVSLIEPDFDLTGFARVYPEALAVVPQFSSSDDSVFTIENGKIHPVAAGVANLIVAAGDDAESVSVEIEVVEGAPVKKWDTSGLVLPTGIDSVVTLDEVEFPEVPEGTADKTTIYGNEYYVVCRVASITDDNYGNGTVANKKGTLTIDIRGLMSFDGNYQYGQLTYKPVARSVVVLHCKANVYYRAASGSYSEKKTLQLGGWPYGEGANGAKVMQLDGVVSTTPEVVGIELSEDSLVVKANKTVAAPTVLSTRADAPLDPNVAIKWSVTSGDTYASVDENTGVITGLAKGNAVVTATYGETGFTASVNVEVKGADEKITATITLSKDDGWFTAQTTTANIDQTVKGVRFQISQSQISTDMVKVYKSQTLKIGGNDITVKKIVLTCYGSGTSDYGPGKFGTGAPTGYSYSAKVGTWEGESTASVNFQAVDGQVRITKLVITYEY